MAPSVYCLVRLWPRLLMALVQLCPDPFIAPIRLWSGLFMTRSVHDPVCLWPQSESFLTTKTATQSSLYLRSLFEQENHVCTDSKNTSRLKTSLGTRGHNFLIQHNGCDSIGNDECMSPCKWGLLSRKRICNHTEAVRGHD